jgi:hypothetical protein
VLTAPPVLETEKRRAVVFPAVPSVAALGRVPVRAAAGSAEVVPATPLLPAAIVGLAIIINQK